MGSRVAPLAALSHEQGTGHHQRLLVGEQHALAGPRRRQGRHQPAAPTMAAMTMSTSARRLGSAPHPTRTSVQQPAASSIFAQALGVRPDRAPRGAGDGRALFEELVHPDDGRSAQTPRRDRGGARRRRVLTPMEPVAPEHREFLPHVFTCGVLLRDPEDARPASGSVEVRLSMRSRIPRGRAAACRCP